MTAIWRDGSVVRWHHDEEQRGVNLGSDWDTYWRFRDQFASVLDPERYTLEWLDRQVAFGAYIVIGNEEACVLCELKSYPAGAMDIHGVLAAGDLETIVEKLIPEALDYGRELGCIGGLIESREGWERELKPFGWSRFQTTLRKALAP
jgi:hypothetical protein